MDVNDFTLLRECSCALRRKAVIEIKERRGRSRNTVASRGDDLTLGGAGNKKSDRTAWLIKEVVRGGVSCPCAPRVGTKGGSICRGLSFATERSRFCN